MDSEEFWRAVEDARSRARSDKEFCAHMKCMLKRLNEEGIRQYYKTYSDIEANAHSFRLWGAAYIINNGCSDDDIFGFIAWLISQGRQTFDRVVADPDVLAEYTFPKSGTFLEKFELLAIQMYERKIGEMPPPDEKNGKKQEEEKWWDFDDVDEMKARYPKLFERYRATFVPNAQENQKIMNMLRDAGYR